MTTLSEKISAKQAELVAARDALVDLTSKMDDSADEATTTAFKEQTAIVAKFTTELDNLKEAENVISKSVARAAPAIVTSNPKHKGENDLVKSALVTFEAHIKRVPIAQIAEERYGNDEAAKAVIGMTTKGAQNIAMTSVAGWAQELVRDAYGSFMDLLKPESVLPRLPLNNFSFDGYNSIKIPMRTGSATSNPNLAGAFRAEGAPIRVGALTLGSMTLTPKELGVIGTFSMELFERSTPNIEQIIREAMISDTAVALDTAFLGSTAGSAIQPGGILAGLAAGNTAASAGATSANIVADLRGRMQAMAQANLGKRPVWVMNPARAWGLQLALTAAGTPLFPEMANGTLLGIPVVTSTTVPAATVFLIDCAEVFFAGGAPRFMGSDVATIHEEDTAPLPIVGAAKTDVANPVRSLFQTNSAALRCLWNIDWQIARPGSVQTITAVAW